MELEPGEIPPNDQERNQAPAATVPKRIPPSRLRRNIKRSVNRWVTSVREEARNLPEGTTHSAYMTQATSELQTTLQRVLEAPGVKGGRPAPKGASNDQAARARNPRRPRCKAKEEQAPEGARQSPQPRRRPEKDSPRDSPSS